MSGAKGGWILAEALVASVIAAVALTTCIVLMRQSDSTRRAAASRANALLIAERVIEEARAASDDQTALSGRADGLSWTVAKDVVSPATAAWPGLRRIRATVHWSDAGAPRSLELETLTVGVSHAASR